MRGGRGPHVQETVRLSPPCCFSNHLTSSQPFADNRRVALLIVALCMARHSHHMQATASPPALRKLTAASTSPAFSVVALYEGFLANIRIMEALEWLKYSLCPELRVCPVTWSFDTLERHDVRTTSVRAAAAADLLIVSAPDESTMPDHVMKWFAAVPQQQRASRPVVVALHEEGSEFGSAQGHLCSRLREVAGSWQTEFMCNAEFDRRLDRDFATQLLSSKSRAPILRAKPFGGEFQSPPRYWGING